MSKIILGLALFLVSFSSHAYDEWDASKLVEAFSKLVACQLGSDNYNQYKAITIDKGMPDMGGLGALYLVYWEGDLGCAGGSGTVVPNFTLVEHSGFMSVKPVVRLDFQVPKLDLVRVTSFSKKNGLVIVKGITYGKTDTQSSPTKNVTYTLKVTYNKLIKQ